MVVGVSAGQVHGGFAYGLLAGLDPPDCGVAGQLGLIAFQEVQRAAGWRRGILAEPLACACRREVVAEQVGVEFDPAGERWGVEEVHDGGQAAGGIVQEGFGECEVWQARCAAHARAGDADALLECPHGKRPLAAAAVESGQRLESVAFVMTVGVLVEGYLGQEFLGPPASFRFFGLQQADGLDDLVLGPVRQARAVPAAGELGFGGLVIIRCPVPLDGHGHMVPPAWVFSWPDRGGTGLPVAEQVLAVAGAEQEGEAVEVAAQLRDVVAGAADEPGQ